jgi:hypothetical protein
MRDGRLNVALLDLAVAQGRRNLLNLADCSRFGGPQESNPLLTFKRKDHEVFEDPIKDGRLNVALLDLAVVQGRRNLLN